MDPVQDYRDRLADLNAQVDQARPAPEVVLGRACGLLAGQTGCRISEAHAYLTRLASAQHRSVYELAAELLTAVEGQATGPVSSISSAVQAAAPGTGVAAAKVPMTGSAPVAEEWVGVVQQLLGALAEPHMLLLPHYGDGGRVEDYIVAAASPGVVDLSGRRGAQLVGRRVSELYPAVVDGSIWQAWSQTLSDGRPREVGPIAYTSAAERASAEAMLTVKMWPVGSGLFNSWIRHDEETRLAERLAHTERLGNLGWGEWDLVTGQIIWSPELYRIYERDPADGPLPRHDSEALTVAEDLPVVQQATETFGRGQPVDITYRIRLGERIKHIRAIIDAARDGNGQPIKIYGIIQDVTAREISRVKFDEVERQLREHQHRLAAEHRLAIQLQQIVLPVPQQPIDLPGLRAAVRYLPAEQASRVGGDWYHAAPAGDGTVLLAVGDVAGHGLQAAAAMAQLRHAMAAICLTTTNDPGRLLGHLNRLLCTGTVASAPGGDRLPVTATAVVARYEPATGRLVWAQAGHPAPLLARDGSTVQLEPPEGPLLGAFATAAYPTATVRLHPGDLLLLYTDGLIENRRHSLEEGLAPVLTALNRITAAPAPQPLADLLGRLHRANPDDDTCVLAARVLSATAPASAPATVSSTATATVSGQEDRDE
ncbi:SpoIIE family protein phosphatase [Planobispora siamensis]|uniref:PPM-type phosphatase domain-containing protein n=1 Tax=Planobispora siamensis TaxID=936338 RepID=A0A8J3WNP8_9ACTN|nr:SpoIIE family protein phosphatase [Planobispora siamensis]GIH96258.1 hypothetical protein Psi01_68880 [Planobispora siamensis]